MEHAFNRFELIQALEAEPPKSLSIASSLWRFVQDTIAAIAKQTTRSAQYALTRISAVLKSLWDFLNKDVDSYNRAIRAQEDRYCQNWFHLRMF